MRIPDYPCSPDYNGLDELLMNVRQMLRSSIAHWRGVDKASQPAAVLEAAASPALDRRAHRTEVNDLLASGKSEAAHEDWSTLDVRRHRRRHKLAVTLNVITYTGRAGQSA